MSMFFPVFLNHFLVLLISLVIKQLLARSSTSIRVASKKGYRVTGAIYSTTTEPRLLNCIQVWYRTERAIECACVARGRTIEICSINYGILEILLWIPINYGKGYFSQRIMIMIRLRPCSSLLCFPSSSPDIISLFVRSSNFPVVNVKTFFTI